ncbi:MAG: co-chaperone GroES, partial [Candidatus Krumholzibacteria bacterium]|nr:co-chaperone GroES [Candidatus Krumholzibacteria bacterium]
DENGKIIKLNVKVGDKVLYSKYGGNELEYEGEQYLIMSESDIYAVFK